MAIQFNGHLPALREAFYRSRLTLYLGAGVSKANGLPSWEELVQALYFSTLKDESYIQELKPYPNYLFALAEWVLKQKNEPLEIIIRKIKQWYSGEEFIEKLADTLYAGFGRDIHLDINGLPEFILNENRTLKAIIDCCIKSTYGIKGLSSIISYNYDNLIELGLEKYPSVRENFQVIYKQSQRFQRGKIPIYHVHGYIPYQHADVNYEDIVFSEDQYNKAFQDPFFWGNMVQVNNLTNNTGLMIGLSLSDRNTRRILDAIQNQPQGNSNYIFIRTPKLKTFDSPSPEFDHVKAKAEQYLDKFPKSRLKMPDKEPHQIQKILERIYEYEKAEFKKGFESLGLNIITFDEFYEIADMLNQIAN